MRLTKRDIQILETLHTARYMSTPQIQRLFWRDNRGGKYDGLKACQYRLRQLTNEGLVRRIEIPVKMGEGRKPYIYALDQQAVYWLNYQLGIPEKEIEWKAKPREENYPFLEHLLATNDFRINLTIACEQTSEIELVEWEDENELRRYHDKVTIENERGGKQKIEIVPDGFFILRMPDRELYFFVEIDRGTVTIEPSKWERRGWVQKIQAYQAYYHHRTETQDGQAVSPYQKRYNTMSFRVLTVTTSGLRQEHLVNATEATASGQEAYRYWFTTFEQINDDLLTAPIWTVATKTADGHQSLLV